MISSINRFFADVGRVFMKPFAGLPVIMWVYFVFSYIAVPHNTTWLGDLPDSDDYTYLTQTLDWLQGQSWFDNIQHRMNPPDGVAIHYTRLAELPIAAVIMWFRVLHYSWHGAALLTSYLLPLIYLGFLFTALRWVADELVGRDWSRLTCFIAMFCPALMFKFAPGQVDHHGLEAILTITAVGCAIRFFVAPGKIIWPVAVGFLNALALAIALETLPWVTITAAVIGVWCLWQGAKARQGVMVFGLSLFIFSALFLLMQKTPHEFFQHDLLAYSVDYVIFCGTAALGLIVAALLTRIEHAQMRFIIGAITVFILGSIYLLQYPSLLAGPYGAMDTRLAALFFDNLEEAEPMTARYGILKLLLCSFTSLLAIYVALERIKTAGPDRKFGWGLMGVLLAAAIALAVFYQVRVLIYALLFSIIPLTAFVQDGWTKLAATGQGRKRFWAEIGLILLVGPLTSILLPALQDGRSFGAGVMMFPAQGFDDNCQMRSIEKILNAPEYTQHAPLRIASAMDQGPELLFRTAHAVFSAPYHTNVSGNLDMLDFFSATDPAKAQEIVRRDGINLVVLCRNIPDMYFQDKEPHYFVLPDGQMKMRPDSSFAGQLVRHQAPDWLREIAVPSPSNYVLFEVK